MVLDDVSKEISVEIEHEPTRREECSAYGHKGPVVEPYPYVTRDRHGVPGIRIECLYCMDSWYRPLNKEEKELKENLRRDFEEDILL